MCCSISFNSSIINFNHQQIPKEHDVKCVIALQHLRELSKFSFSGSTSCVMTLITPGWSYVATKKCSSL